MNRIILLTIKRRPVTVGNISMSDKSAPARSDYEKSVLEKIHQVIDKMQSGKWISMPVKHVEICDVQIDEAREDGESKSGQRFIFALSDDRLEAWKNVVKWADEKGYRVNLPTTYRWNSDHPTERVIGAFIDDKHYDRCNGNYEDKLRRDIVDTIAEMHRRGLDSSVIKLPFSGHVDREDQNISLSAVELKLWSEITQEYRKLGYQIDKPYGRCYHNGTYEVIYSNIEKIPPTPAEYVAPSVPQAAVAATAPSIPAMTISVKPNDFPRRDHGIEVGLTLGGIAVGIIGTLLAIGAIVSFRKRGLPPP